MKGAVASTMTRQLRSAHGVGPIMSGYVTVTLTFCTPIAAWRTTLGMFVQITTSGGGGTPPQLGLSGPAAGLPAEPWTIAERVPSRAAYASGFSCHAAGVAAGSPGER